MTLALARLIFVLAAVCALSAPARSDSVARPGRPEARTLQAAAPRGWGWYPPQTRVPQDHILVNATLEATLARVAAPAAPAAPGAVATRGTIVFSTLRFSDAPGSRHRNATLDMVNSFSFWLHSAGLLQHTLLITTDEATWAEVAARGHPVYLDRVFPRREAYVDATLPKDTPNRETDVEKLWWGMRLTELGYRVVYLSVDTVILRKGLLKQFEEPYDVQGLSDWAGADAALVGGAAAAPRACGIRRPGERGFEDEDDNEQELVVPGSGKATAAAAAAGAAAAAEEAIEKPPAEQQSGGTGSVPCQSTQLWLLQPTEVTVAFMRALVRRVVFEKPLESEEAAWNELILSFLWAAGDQQPMRYRLLPVEAFANAPVVTARLAAGLPIELVAVHAGGLRGLDAKIEAFQAMGVFRSEFEGPGKAEMAPRFGAVGAAGAGAGGLRYPGQQVHHYKPSDDKTFWRILFLMMGGMVMGAAAVGGWQLCAGRRERARHPSGDVLARRAHPTVGERRRSVRYANPTTLNGEKGAAAV